MSFFNELKRRNVLRVAAAYVVTAWLVIQVVETILPAFGYGDIAVRVVTIVFGIGLIPSLVFAWAFELTPEGLKKEKDVDRTQSIAPRTGRRLDRMIMVVLALALGYFAFDKFVLDPKREAVVREQFAEQVEEARLEGRAEALVQSYGEKSIAVLPFANMSSDEAQEYFSDGVSEELLNLLSKVPDLRVISRSSAFSFKGKDIEIPEIAERLNVAYILEGSVRKFGNQVRITAQLIEARSDTHLWSETYDRQLDNIFAIQDEVAAEVVSQLQITLLGEEPQSQIVDTKAYALYLQGRHIRQNQRDAAGMLKAEQILMAALDIQPNYLDAWIEMFAVYHGQEKASALSHQESMLKTSTVVAEIETLDPGNPVVLVQRAREARDAGHFQEFASMIQAAFEDHPNFRGAIFYTYVVLHQLMRYDEAMALSEWYRSLDPTSCASPVNIAWARMLKGDYANAIIESRRALELCPMNPNVRYGINQALVLLGRPVEALEEVKEESNPNNRLYILAIAHNAMGNEAQSVQALKELKQRYVHDPELIILIASAHAFRAEPDQAFDWLARMDENLALEVEFRWDMPEFVPLRDDPRWMALIDRYWLTPDELAAIKFEVTLP